MAKRKYAVRKDAGKIKRDHSAAVVDAIRAILIQEQKSEEAYTDAEIAEMICNAGLLTHKGRVFELRSEHNIPNMSERKIVNFAKRHKA